MPQDPHTFQAWRAASQLALDAERQLAGSGSDAAAHLQESTPSAAANARLLRQRAMQLLEQLLVENQARCRLLAFISPWGAASFEDAAAMLPRECPDQSRAR